MTEDSNGFWKAVMSGDVEQAGALLEISPELVHARRGWGSTPLHNAAMEGKKEMAALLLDRNADVNAKNELGDTPLRIAMKYGKWEVAALLREKGGEY